MTYSKPFSGSLSLLRNTVVTVTHLNVVNVTDKAVVFRETKEVGGDARRVVIIPKKFVLSCDPTYSAIKGSWVVVTITVPKWLAEDRELVYE